MYKCDRCGREDFKSESGLKRHMNGCEVTIEETEEEYTSLVDTEQVEENPFDKVEQPKSKTQLLYEEQVRVELKIKKLQDARKSTWDAEARYRIEQEIAALRRGI